MKSLDMMTDHKKINMPQTKPEITYKKMAYDYIYAEIAKGHYAAGERIVAKTIADELESPWPRYAKRSWIWPTAE